MDERLVKLLEMRYELVADIGATDVSVLELALSITRSDSVVISIDQKLVTECKNAGLTAKNIWEVIS